MPMHSVCMDCYECTNRPHAIVLDAVCLPACLGQPCSLRAINNGLLALVQAARADGRSLSAFNATRCFEPEKPSSYEHCWFGIWSGKRLIYRLSLNAVLFIVCSLCIIVCLYTSVERMPKPSDNTDTTNRKMFRSFWCLCSLAVRHSERYIYKDIVYSRTRRVIGICGMHGMHIKIKINKQTKIIYYTHTYMLVDCCRCAATKCLRSARCCARYTCT